MQTKVIHVLRNLCGLNPGDTLLVGVSGGPDSITMLDVLSKLDFHLVVAHLDHQLRFESSIEGCGGYRLPTSDEWEIAARAGSSTATYNGDLDGGSCESAVLDPIAWYCGNSGDELHEVGQLEPNAWGLYDMLGNVAEWYHVDDLDVEAHTRGGSYRSEARDVRAAATKLDDDPLWIDVGFRVVRTIRSEE